MKKSDSTTVRTIAEHMSVRRYEFYRTAIVFFRFSTREQYPQKIRKKEKVENPKRESKQPENLQSTAKHSAKVSAKVAYITTMIINT